MKTALTLVAALATTFSFAADTAPKPYPLKTCIVSGEKLGSMGKPPVLVQDGQEVQFCCKNCIKDFKKDPQKYLKEIAEKAKAK
jgi:hypothetical protein